jgi:hypothetical protein
MVSRLPCATATAIVIVSASAIATACAPVGSDPPSSDETASDEAEIIGGSASSRRSVVVAVDEDDLYLCTGVVIRSDAVLLAFPCAARATAVYVGYSASVLSDEPLGPKAGSATKIAVTGSDSITLQADRLTWAYVAHLATPTTAVAALAPTLPSASTSCAATGYGATSGTNPTHLSGPYLTGLRRTVRMEVTSSSGSAVRAKGLNGSILWADFDAFLFCGGRLVGPVASWDHTTPDHYVFAALSSTTNACALGGGACTYDECTPGTTQKTTAGCASGERARTCQANGRWGPYSSTCF